MGFLAELLMFLPERKKFWLSPTIKMAVTFGGLVVLSWGSAQEPFI